MTDVLQAVVKQWSSRGQPISCQTINTFLKAIFPPCSHRHSSLSTCFSPSDRITLGSRLRSTASRWHRDRLGECVRVSYRAPACASGRPRRAISLPARRRQKSAAMRPATAMLAVRPHDNAVNCPCCLKTFVVYRSGIWSRFKSNLKSGRRRSCRDGWRKHAVVGTPPTRRSSANTGGTTEPSGYHFRSAFE